MVNSLLPRGIGAFRPLVKISGSEVSLSATSFLSDPTVASMVLCSWSKARRIFSSGCQRIVRRSSFSGSASFRQVEFVTQHCKAFLVEILGSFRKWHWDEGLGQLPVGLL